MWISQIELTNFKSYQHAVMTFPKPSAGKNIVLIGGMNGFGKTSILEALYLCLYGKDAIAHLARAGLKVDDQRGYRTFLERALNGEAKRKGTDHMWVRVQISQGQNEAIDIRRRWYFKESTGAWLEEEATANLIQRGVPGVPMKDGSLGFLLSEMLEKLDVPPAHIAPFFFFDGEEVKKLADQSRIEQIKQGLEGLMGVVLLRNLAERLKQFEANERSGITNVDTESIDKLLASLTADEAKLKALSEDRAVVQQQLLERKKLREEFIERLTVAGGGGGDIASVKDLVEEREQIRQARREVQKKLEKILAEKLPFHLMPSGLLQEFKKQIESEIALVRWEAECKSLEPKRTQFENAFLMSPALEFTPALTNAQQHTLKKRIEAAWASLFHPAPTDCAEEVVHSYLHEGLREKALNFLDSLNVGQQEVQSLLNTQREHTSREEELSRKISRLEGVDRDGTFAELKKNLNTVTVEIDALENRLRSDEREVIGVEAQVKNQRARYEKEVKRRDETSPVRSLLNKSERVRNVIEEIVPLLFPLKVGALAESMTRVYKQLAHKNQVSKILIDNDGTTTILGKTGKEITFDRSAGENQIFATALIAGLAEVSGVNSPMVVDTPLGRLDSVHRQNIFQFWISDSKRQVILLSQDEEIDSQFYERIKDNVSVTYLLEHTDVGEGVGRTTVKEGTYFEVQA